jgi:RNA polymerase sigma factor (sigma-70 family)
MRTNRTSETTLVVAAQSGDRQAMEELLATHLPFVYTIVSRAMDGEPDADDVVQETMLRVVRELPQLHHPGSFRAWLAAITVRQVSTQQYRGHRRSRRTAGLDEITEAAEAEPGFEDVSVLNLDLARQRGQLVRARQWLDQKDQTLLALWWLEIAGQFTRADLAQALEVSIAHATVRIQRLRIQLDLSRAIQAAIEARPRCADLDAVLRGWDGRKTSAWRKRIARHTRSCPVCRPRADDLIPPEGLLFALLPVPLALTAGVLDKITLGGTAAGTSSAALTGGKAGFATHALHAIAAHPVTVLLVTGSVVAGTAAVTSNWPTDRSTPPVVIAVPSASPDVPDAPSPTRTALRPSRTTPRAIPTTTSTRAKALALRTGPASLESAGVPGRFVSTALTYGVLTAAGPGSSRGTRAQATFDVVTGLADPACFSFRLSGGDYLRHSSWRLRTFGNDGTALFRGDATFCPGPGATQGSITLESSNYPGWFLHHRGDQLWVDQDNGTKQFLADSSFFVRSPLANE